MDLRGRTRNHSERRTTEVPDREGTYEQEGRQTFTTKNERPREGSGRGIDGVDKRDQVSSSKRSEGGNSGEPTPRGGLVAKVGTSCRESEPRRY